MKTLKITDWLIEGVAIAAGFYLGCYMINEFIRMGYVMALQDVMKSPRKPRASREGNVYKWPFSKKPAPSAEAETPAEPEKTEPEKAEGLPDGVA